MVIVIGAVFTTLGITYDGIDIAVPSGLVLVAIGVSLFIIQHRMAKAIKA